MSRPLRSITLILMLALAFSAYALHPYSHDLHADEAPDCQVCLHQASTPQAAGHPPLQLPEPAFQPIGTNFHAQPRVSRTNLPPRRARGPPLSA